MNEKELFKLCLDFVLKAEGGYVCDADDPGGATNMGITQYTYNSYLSKLKKAAKNVKYITKEEVSDIYYKMYWVAAGCDKMNPIFGALCFDTAVNMGISRVSEFLKAASYISSEKFILARIMRYVDLAKKGNQKKFLLGWLNRVMELIKFINERIIKDAKRYI